MTCRTPAVHLNRDYLLFEETCSAPALNLGSGALYGSINKMLEQGLIEESEERPDPHLDDERRRSYRITPLGKRVAQAEAVRMRQLVRLAEARLGLPGLREARHGRSKTYLPLSVEAVPRSFPRGIRGAAGTPVPR